MTLRFVRRDQATAAHAATTGTPTLSQEMGHSSELPADFRRSFEANAPFVMRILARLGVPRSDRDDLLQEVFLVVHRKLPEYDGRASFRAWLYGICFRTASSYRRSAQVRRQKSQHYGDIDDRESHVAIDPEHSAESRRAYAEVEAALGKLEEEKRMVLVLYDLEEMQMVEVAQTVGCRLQTAYSRLHAARKAMRILVMQHRSHGGWATIDRYSAREAT